MIINLYTSIYHVFINLVLFTRSYELCNIKGGASPLKLFNSKLII